MDETLFADFIRAHDGSVRTHIHKANEDCALYSIGHAESQPGESRMAFIGRAYLAAIDLQPLPDMKPSGHW